ncbi:MAG TPA: c-type cytochrome [Vicinamibacterales bacterium]|nr:c-type cytochrome [Vicinamibacterales bacterium]
MAIARRLLLALGTAAVLVLATPTVADAAQSPAFGVGHAATPSEIRAIDIDIAPDGRGLPPGGATAAAGKDVYTRRCETCHGPTGTEGPQDILVGGRGSLSTAKPVKTVGSYWPYATTLWDYIRRAMPFDHPGTLTDMEIYGATAYILFMNGIVGEHDDVDQQTLPLIKMPNRNGFVADPRPDIPRRRLP